MNPKHTWILLATAAGLFAFIYFVESRWKPPAPVVAYVLPGLDAGEVASIEIHPLKQDAIRVERTNGVWQLTKPAVYPAQSMAVDEFLKAAGGLISRRQLTSQELKGHDVDAEFGFDTPQAMIILQQGSETPRRLMLGNYTPAGDGVYARVVGMTDIEVLDATFLKTCVPLQADTWRDRTFVDLQALAFDRLTVSNGSKTFELQREFTNGPWSFAPNKPLLAPADSAKIRDLLFRLQNLNISRFETDKPADLELYGLQTPALELTFSLGTNPVPVLSLQFGKKATNDAEQVYARRTDRGGVVQVAGGPVRPWQEDSTTFRDRFIAGQNAARADVFEVWKKGEIQFTVSRRTNGLLLVTVPASGLVFRADTNSLRQFITDLDQLQAVNYNKEGQFTVKDVPTQADLSSWQLVPQPALEYVMKQTVNSTNGSLTNELLKLDFGGQSNDLTFARRVVTPEETSVYAVRSDDVLKLPVSGFQLFDRRAWNFNVSNVTHLTVRVKLADGSAISSTWDHVRQGDWKAVTGFSNPTIGLYLEEGVDVLGSLEAQEWLERGDQNQDGYGLTSPLAEITVELKNGDKQTLKLGNPSSNPATRGSLYASVKNPDDNMQTWVFQLSAHDFNNLRDWLLDQVTKSQAP